MKKIAAVLLLLAPMGVMGDVPRPICRVQRIGYEVFGEGENNGQTPETSATDKAEETGVLLAVSCALALAGMLSLLIAKKDPMSGMMRAIKVFHANKWGKATEGCVILGSVIGVLSFFGGRLLFYSWDWKAIASICWLLWCVFLVWKVVSVLMCLVLRRSIQWLSCGVKILVAGAMIGCIGRIWWVDILAFPALFDPCYVPPYSDNPGWKYPHEISVEEKKVIDVLIDKVMPDFKRAYDVEYEILNAAGKLDQIDGSGSSDAPRPVYLTGCGNRWLVMESVLRKNQDLRSRCKGIPIDSLEEKLEWRRPPFDPVVYKECCSCQGRGTLEGRHCDQCWGVGMVRREKLK